MFGLLQNLFSPPALLSGPASLLVDEPDGPLAPDPLMDEFAAILEKAGWAAHARVVRVDDEEFGATIPVRTTHYDVDGAMTMGELQAYKAWTPHRVDAALQEAAKRPSDSVCCLLELDPSPAGLDPVVIVRGQETKLLSLAGPDGLVIVPFSLYSADSMAALKQAESASAGADKAARRVNVVALCMDVDPTSLPESPLVVAWAGHGGYNSQAGKVLAVDDVSPCCYLLAKDGRVVEAGNVAHVLAPHVPSDIDADAVGDDGDGDGSAAVPLSRVMRLVREALPRMEAVGELQGTRGLTMMLRTRTTKSKATRRLYVAGNIFPEAEDAFEAFGEWLDNAMPRVGWRGCRHMTRPIPPAPASACTQCKSSSVKLACLCCARAQDDCDVTLCAKCARGHPLNHPLLVLDVGSTDEALYGRGHVLWFEEQPLSELHPGIQCDACRGLVPGLRYRNLCKEDHDLCQACFALLCELGPQCDETTFADQFGCHQTDAFAEIKSSCGLEISRDRNLLAFAHAHSLDDDDDVDEDEDARSDVPPGHTPYSWRTAADRIGIGHTAYSWGGV